MRLVYCSGGNNTYMALATSLGWHAGVRSGATIYASARPLSLLDIAYQRPDWAAHLAIARIEHPALAAVPDVMRPADLGATFARAGAIAPHCDAVLIIPKCRIIDQLPRAIGGTPVVLGYSVPSTYGGTPLPVWEFRGWPVHLLGGTPRRQIDLARYLDVVSADGNMAQKLAHRGLAYDERGHPRLMIRWEDKPSPPGMPARALARSLVNIAALWRQAGYILEERP